MANQFGNPHRAAMFALMGAGGRASNTELEAIAGFRIRKDVRLDLRDSSMLQFHRQGNSAFIHTLTRAGWAWCTEELVADLPEQPGPLGGALYSVLRGMDGALQSRNLTLREFLSSASDNTAGDIEGDIRAAYRKLATRPRAFVRLAALRSLLNGSSRADVDEALRTMSQSRRANLMPESNRKTLTDADHRAAIHIGRQDNHLIEIVES